MKAGIYLRVSTDQQTTDSQEYICLEYCRRNNIEVYKIYKDIYTGTASSRPEFNVLLDDLRTYKFDVLVVSKLDRLARSLQHLLSFIDELNKKGVGLAVVTQNIDTISSAGKLQLQIIGAFAEFERNLISERTKEGLRKAVNTGKRGKDKKPRKKRGSPKSQFIYK